MNVLSNKVSVEGYFSKCVSEKNKTLMYLPTMTIKGVVVHKIICENKMITRINVTERTRILVEGRMISGVIHATHIFRLN